MTSNQALADWVEEIARLTRPEKIHWCDGSKEDRGHGGNKEELLSNVQKHFGLKANWVKGKNFSIISFDLSKANVMIAICFILATLFLISQPLYTLLHLIDL